MSLVFARNQPTATETRRCANICPGGRMRLFRVVAVLGTAAAGLAMALPASPASATVTGAVAFTCEAHLAQFPSPLSNGNCTNGALPAAALGVGAGTDNGGGAYAIAGAGTGNFNSVFQYNETCAASV